MCFGGGRGGGRRVVFSMVSLFLCLPLNFVSL